MLHILKILYEVRVEPWELAGGRGGGGNGGIMLHIATTESSSLFTLCLQSTCQIMPTFQPLAVGTILGWLGNGGWNAAEAWSQGCARDSEGSNRMRSLLG